MSQFKRTTITIDGDGNAIGDSNNITILNETHNYEYRQNPGYSNSPAALVGMVLFAISGIALALTALAYCFGKHATTIYAVELSLPFVCAVTAVMLMTYSAYQDDLSNYKHAGIVAAIAALLTLAVKMAAISYSSVWMELADSAQDYKQFWCSLSLADQQNTLQHAIQALILLAPATILVAVHTLSALFRYLDLLERPDSLFQKMTGTTSLVITGALCVLSLVAHTESSFSMWQNKFNSSSSLICPYKNSESP